MIQFTKPLSKQIKEAKIICFIIGGFYSVFRLFAIVMLKLQTIMLKSIDSQFPSELSNTQNLLFDIWIIYMPLMIIIGLCYIGLGTLFEKLGSKRFIVNIILSVFSLIWVVAYTFACIPYIEAAFNDFNTPEAFRFITYGFAAFGFIAVFGLFTGPQIAIGLKIRKINRGIISNATQQPI